MKIYLLVVVGIFAWAQAYANVTSIPQKDRKVVDACAQSIPVGTHYKIDTTFKELCFKRGPKHPQAVYFQNPERYTISKDRDGVHIKFKLRLRIHPAKTTYSRARFILSKTRECMKDIRKKWASYGIKMDIRVDSTRQRTWGKPQTTLNLYDRFGRSDALDLYFKGLNSHQKLPGGMTLDTAPNQNCIDTCKTTPKLFGLPDKCASFCEPLRQKEYCLMLLHETGHMVGLPDEYEDKAICPDRPFISKETNPWSVMAAPYLGFLPNLPGLDAVEFFPRHMRTIMGTLCSPPQSTAPATSAIENPNPTTARPAR